MKQMQFSKLAMGQRFKYKPEVVSVLERIEPQPHGFSHDKPCRKCGEPKETWLNASEVGTGMRQHVCINRPVYVVDDNLQHGSEPVPEERIRRKAEEILRQKKLNYEVKQDGQLWVRQGSTLVGVIISKWQNRILVVLSAPVALNAQNITPEVTRSLLIKSGQTMLGSYFVGSEGDSVWYGHTLFGESMEADDLLLSMAIIGMTADQNDDEIAGLVQGQRAIDVMTDKRVDI